MGPQKISVKKRKDNEETAGKWLSEARGRSSSCGEKEAQRDACAVNGEDCDWGASGAKIGIPREKGEKKKISPRKNNV